MLHRSSGINHEFCDKNHEFRIKNDEFGIQNDDFCIQNDEFSVRRACPGAVRVLGEQRRPEGRTPVSQCKIHQFKCKIHHFIAEFFDSSHISLTIAWNKS